MKKAQTTKASGTTRRRATQPARATRPAPHPIFDALIMEAMRAPREALRSTDEVARELGITDEERAAARARIAQWEPDAPDNDGGAEGAEDRDAGGAPVTSLARQE